LGGRELLLVGAFGLLVSWTALSALWSSNAEAPLLEAERSSVYAAAAGATILLASRRAARVLPLGVLAATVAVAAYALATRLVPDHVGTFDSSGGYQLAAPIGYWNA